MPFNARWPYNRENVRKLIRKYEGKVILKDDKGALYKTELAPSADEYLDWDQALSEQSERVQSLLGVRRNRDIAARLAAMRAKTGGDLSRLTTQEKAELAQLSEEYKASNIHGLGLSMGDTPGRELYHLLTARHGSASSASEYLHSLGIRGIRYPAEGGRKGDDRFNYVIFSDEDVAITAKFSRSAIAPTAISDIVDFYDKEVSGKVAGGRVPNVKFVFGVIDDRAAKELQRFLDGYDGQRRQLRISGRTLKHIDESRPKLAREIIQNLGSFFQAPDDVLPDHKNPGKRAFLVHLGEGEKAKSHVATVEVEVEVNDGFVEVVSVMTAPARSLRPARALKENWPEGQRSAKKAHSPHPVAAKAAHAEADFPSVRPVGESIEAPSAISNSDERKNTMGSSRWPSGLASSERRRIPARR